MAEEPFSFFFQSSFLSFFFFSFLFCSFDTIDKSDDLNNDNEYKNECEPW